MRLGFGEIVVVLALALLFFGPSKLPQLGSSLGQAIKSFKKGLSSIHEDDSGAAEQEAKQLPARPDDGTPAASDQVAARGTKR